MKYTSNRNTRLVLAQYIFSNGFMSTDIEEILDMINMEFDDIEINMELLNNLIKIYEEKKEYFNNILQSLFDNESCFDKFIIALAIGAMCEIEFGTDMNLVVSEFTKICVISDSNFKLLNGILHKYKSTIQINK